MIDIHGYSRRLESARLRLASLDNGELLLAFINHLEALGLSKGRLAKYANHICAIMKKHPFNPSDATRKDVERVIAWINSQPYKTSTKDDLRLVVRKLVQYAKYGSCARGTPTPPEVAWFSVKSRGSKDSRVKPESLLTIEEVEAMMAAAENERDRALVSVLFEAALRPGELLGMTVGSVEFRDEYCLISVNGKTGVKRIPLVASYRPLLDWLQKHPRRSDLKAPLWASIGNNSKGGRVSYHYFRKLLRKLAEKAGVKKEVWPYLFRHTALTNLAKVFTEAKLELYAGWVQGSKMTRRYVHFSARDLEDSVLQLHGLKKEPKHIGILKAVECPRCGSRNTPEAVRCGFCGYILSKEVAVKMEEEKRKREKAIIERIERIERAVEALLNGTNRPKQASSKPEPPPKASTNQPYEQQHTHPQPSNHHKAENMKI